MPETVRCDVCGKIYSSRHLSSHKRLAHGGRTGASGSPGEVNEQDAMRRIIELFGGLSEENRKRVLHRLTPGA